MAKVIYKTSAFEDINKLNGTQIKLLLALIDISKENHINMDEKNYVKLSKMIVMEEKTIRNNLKALVKNEIIVKAGTLPNYVIDPAILVKGNEKKCLENFQTASNNSHMFRKLQGQKSLKSRGDFESKKLEGYIDSKRKNDTEHSNIEKEAKEYFEKK